MAHTYLGLNDSTKPTEDMKRLQYQEFMENCLKLSSAHVVIMHPQPMWKSIRDLYKIKPVYIPASLWRDPVLSTLAEELWVVGRCWWDRIHVFQGMWTLVVHASMSGWVSYPHVSMGSTNWIQRLIKEKRRRYAYESEELEECERCGYDSNLLPSHMKFSNNNWLFKIYIRSLLIFSRKGLWRSDE